MKQKILSCLTIVIVLTGLLAGCQTDMTPDTLRKWTYNDEGLSKLSEVMAAPETSDETRVQIIDVLIDEGLSLRTRQYVGQAADPEGLANILQGRLTQSLASPDRATGAKNGLLGILKYLPKDQQGVVKNAIADWVFTGLSQDSTTKAIKEQFEKRFMVSQLEDLGRHGTQGAALLMSRQFAVDQLFSFLISFKEPQFDAMALDALQKIAKLPNVEIGHNHLARIGKIKSARSAAYLLSLYTQLEDEGLAGEAFNQAADLMDEPQVAAQKDILLPALKVMLKTSNPDDRRFSAASLIKVGGAPLLQNAFDGFIDDGTYSNGEFEPLDSALGFCESSVGKLKEDPSGFLTTILEKGNRIQKAFALTCLKVRRGSSALPAIAKLTRSKTDLSDFFGQKIQMGQLAKNTIDGIKLLEQLETQKTEGTITEAKYGETRTVILTTIDKTGAKYAEAAKMSLPKDKRSKRRRR